jgi:hypothetical protein
LLFSEALLTSIYKKLFVRCDNAHQINRLNRTRVEEKELKWCLRNGKNLIESVNILYRKAVAEVKKVSCLDAFLDR